MSEIVFAYRGVHLYQTHRGFELVENGRLLAVVKVAVVAERLFLHRALALATAEVEQMQQQAAFTEEGKRVFFPNPPDRPTDGHPPLGKGGKKRETSAFKKPTVEEIDAYCAARKNGLSGQAIYDHYEANGWMVGRVKMKDWKAAVRTWEKKAAEFAPPTAPKKGVALTNPEHSSLDIQAYEDEAWRFRPKFKGKELPQSPPMAVPLARREAAPLLSASQTFPPAIGGNLPSEREPRAVVGARPYDAAAGVNVELEEV